MTVRSKQKKDFLTNSHGGRKVFPFAAIVGQGEMKLALLLNVIAPAIGGVLIMGERGTGKSTAVRALADLLPSVNVVRGCVYNCDPKDSERLCEDCRARAQESVRLPRARVPVPVVELPLGATEDRVCGTIDVERALRAGERAFEPGLLARANRGFLYIDEVNLLEDHLVDLLLDVSVTGVNRVEREGVSLEHPSRFVLVGSGNPEEGELRPQLLDRFGLFTEVRTVAEIDERVRIVERCEDFERDTEEFGERFEQEQEALRKRITRARRAYASVEVSRDLLRKVAELCARLGVDGHRGELTVVRAARALAAFEGRRRATEQDVRRVAAVCLAHRLRRDPLEQSSGGARVEDGVRELFGTDEEEASDSGDGTRGEREGASGDELPDNAVGSGPASGSEKRVVPPAEASLPEETFARNRGAKNVNGKKISASHGRTGARRSGYSARGRYSGSTQVPKATNAVALDATMRAAANRVSARAFSETSRALRFTASDLRFKRYRSKSGTLFILAVDTSGSMALNRIGQAKGAIAHLLRRSYVKRDRIALICFREHDGDVLLRPSGSTTRARRILDALPVGGATPLPAGLLRALEVARRAQAEGTRRVVLIVFTDGRANVALSTAHNVDRNTARKQVSAEIEKLGAAIRRLGISAFVVDTGNRFTSAGEGAQLAAALGGRYLQLPPSITNQTLTETLSI